ncbi:MAG: TRAP transporter TatT component family protein [Deltaproteobacteria bacterium]|nr:TRAP transporter TatT component family protein [Deltaproteobacteria bacterium]
MLISGLFKRIPLIFLLIVLPSACVTSKTMTVASTALLLEDVAKASNRQSDLKLIREGMPSYLMLIDGMVEALPDNKRLLITAAQSYASYASAFIQDEDKAYAVTLYAKAKEYALRALEQNGFKNPLSRPFDDFETGLQKMGTKDVPYLFWAASCWGSWISLNMRSMEAMAELPRVEAMMKRVLVLDETFYYGGAHIFMGVLEASKPRIAGGNLNRARDHFLKAIELGNGRFLMAKVYYANYYAKKAFDRELYISTLENVLEIPVAIVPELTLLNTVAHTKAKKMLGEVDEYF